MVRGQLLAIALVVFGVWQSAGASTLDDHTIGDHALAAVVGSDEKVRVGCAVSAGAGESGSGVRPVTSASVILAYESSGVLLLFLGICGASAISWRHFPRE